MGRKDLGTERGANNSVTPRWVVARWLRRSPLCRGTGGIRFAKKRRYVHYMRLDGYGMGQWVADIQRATVFKSYSTARRWHQSSTPWTNDLIEAVADGVAGVGVRRLTPRELRAYTGRIIAQGE